VLGKLAYGTGAMSVAFSSTLLDSPSVITSTYVSETFEAYVTT